MKKLLTFIGFLSAAVIFIPCVYAQSGSASRGQSLNGAIGLYSIPTARIGWENSDFGIDFGYHATINNDAGVSHITAVTMSLFKWLEISSALDIQPDINNQPNNDLLFGVKFKLPTKNTAIALGTNAQIINIGNKNYNYMAFQPYIALTYAGNFFSMNAETTVVFGKTIYYNGPENNSNIDFGMGFDLVLFPDVFSNIVHWLIDFANFSYSDDAWINRFYYHSGGAWYRGTLNTGLRIDLSAIPAFSKFKFLIDAAFIDLFDAGERSFTIGAVFGFTIK